MGIPISAGSSKLSGSHEADTSDDDLSSIVPMAGSLRSKGVASCWNVVSSTCGRMKRKTVICLGEAQDSDGIR